MLGHFELLVKVYPGAKKLSEDKEKVQKQLKAEDLSAEQRTELEQKKTELCVKLGAGGKADTNFKLDLDRSNMRSDMQLGAFKCLGTCGTVYKVQKAASSHMRLVRKANEQGNAGQNNCWQPGFSPPPPPVRVPPV